MGRSKGTNLLHMQTWVLQHAGEDAWERVVREMPPEDHRQLESLVAVGWYDLALQHRLLRTIDAVLGAGDLALVPTIGEFEAEQDLTRIHRAFLRLASPAFVLRMAGDYWSRFYDTGRWQVTRDGPKSARGTLTGFTPVDSAFCMYLEAYIERMFRMTGAHDGRLVHSACVCRGDGACVFEGSWVEG